MEPKSQRVRGIDGRCGAQLRGQSGIYCEKYPVKDRTRCRLHGGKSPTGDRHPSFLHGRRSRYVVSQEAYDRARHDLAITRILFERAIAAGSSGLRELAAVGRCARAYAELVEGKALPATVSPRLTRGSHRPPDGRRNPPIATTPYGTSGSRRYSAAQDDAGARPRAPRREEY